LQRSIVSAALPKRRRDTHKGDFGHVLVIGGDYGMGGAVRMAAEAAMRVGAGLVTVATRPEHLNVVTGARPEIMCSQVADANDLTPLLERSTIVVIGPGLGLSDWAQSLLAAVEQSALPVVVDADALNLLAQNPTSSDRWILTPHPGEAARLLDQTTEQVQADRYYAVSQLQQRYGGVAVLKGAGTLVQAADTITALCSAGNPGMASGGMGDVLSGVLGGLLAQKHSLLEAAEIGVMVHSMAADHAAEQGGERGLLATDVLQQLRLLVNPDDT
jgi:ADP-dependent NAD(P)H-hydrate dehydratase / NAD(P)H-hydrate epimerase